jgi:hypothetical protein
LLKRKITEKIKIRKNEEKLKENRNPRKPEKT